MLKPGYSVTATAPGTIANVAAGLNIFGFSLEQPFDSVTLRLCAGKGLSLATVSGEDTGVFHNAVDNPVLRALGVMAVSLAEAHTGTHIKPASFFSAGGCCPVMLSPRELGRGALAVLSGSFLLEVDLAIGVPGITGAGTGPSLVPAALMAFNRLTGSTCSTRELLLLALEVERSVLGLTHPDITAPALYGAFCLIRNYSPLEILALDVPEDLYCALVSPDLAVSAEALQAALPESVPLQLAISQAGNAAALVAGLLQSNWGTISASCRDYLAEPFRAPLITGFADVKLAAMDEGALGVGISGAGPGVFAFARGRGNAEKIGGVMVAAFLKNGVRSRTYVSKVAGGKPQILEEKPS